MSTPTLIYGSRRGAHVLAANGAGTDAINETETQAFVVSARPRQIAPAGVRGEVALYNFYLVIEQSAATEFTVTPVVGGQAIEDAAHTFELPERGTPRRQSLEVPVALGTWSRHVPRGTWISLQITDEGETGEGVLVLEGVEVELEVVRESLDPP